MVVEHEPKIVLVFALSKQGQQAALEAKRPTGKIQRVAVSPRHACWNAAVGLKPEFAADGFSTVLVGNAWHVEAANVDVADGRWPRPSVVVHRAEKGLELHEWDELPSVAELVAYQQHDLDRLDAALAAAGAQVVAVEERYAEHVIETARVVLSAVDDYHGEKSAGPLVDDMFGQIGKVAQALLAAVGPSGTAPLSLDVEPDAAELLNRLDQAVDACEKARRRQRQADSEAADRNARAKKLAEAKAWATEYGSDRLKRITAEGFLASNLNVYRDERLAAERPGWMWYPKDGSDQDPAGLTDADFALLDQARDVDPAAKLTRTTLLVTNDFSDRYVGGTVAITEFLGRKVYFGTLADLDI